MQKPSFQEFRLISAKDDQRHHIMKFQNAPTFDFDKLQPPVKLTRESTKEEQEDDSGIITDEQGKVIFDPSKVQGNPLRNKGLFKKKTKSYFFERDGALGDEDDGISVLRSKKAVDPDVVPWNLSSSNMDFEGTLEGSQNANYVLFMLAEDGFQVIPAQKWYKFSKKSTHQKLTIEEAEAKISQTKGAQDRWMMHKLKKDEQEPIRRLKLVDKSGDDRIQDDDGLDFEEDFQDDDGLVELGLDDDEEVKEAKKRIIGSNIATRINFEDEEEFQVKQETDEQVKKLKKALVKLEKDDLIESDEENPYASEEEEEEEDKINKKSKPTTPIVKSEQSPSQIITEKRKRDEELAPDTKKMKTDLNRLKRTSSSLSTSSVSPPYKNTPHSPTGSLKSNGSRSGTPLPNDPQIQQLEREIIQLLNQGNLLVNDVVGRMSHLIRDEKMKDALRSILKRVATFDKTTKMLSLKEQFK